MGLCYVLNYTKQVGDLLGVDEGKALRTTTTDSLCNSCSKAQMRSDRGTITRLQHPSLFGWFFYGET